MLALRLLLSNKPDDTFPRVWRPYPRKESKKDALKAWCQLDPDDALIAEILKTLEWQVVVWASRADWYTPPLLATYLRSERWTDERPAAVKPTRAHVVPLAHGVSDQLAANRKIQALIRGGMDQAAAVRQVSLEMGWSQPEE